MIAATSARRRFAREDELLTLLQEVTGEAREDKQAKVAVAEHLIREKYLGTRVAGARGVS